MEVILISYKRWSMNVVTNFVCTAKWKWPWIWRLPWFAAIFHVCGNFLSKSADFWYKNS